MSLRLTVRRSAWEAHVRATVAAIGEVVPVVKGNGYGFGRAVLHPVAATLASEVCVGTVHELDVPDGLTPIVLTPTLDPPSDDRAVLTVGSVGDVDALSGWQGRVIVKLRSTMHRYGALPDEVAEIAAVAAAARMEIVGAAIHLPLAGDDMARLAEVHAWIEHLPTSWPLSVSHLAPAAFADLRRAHPRRSLRLRLGTALWHGDKSFLHLDADVLATHRLPAGAVAGYHATPLAEDATVVMIGAGTANGIAVLADGSSPFHYRRRRIALLERPHMHTSMGLIPADDPAPQPGERVDVQRPLIVSDVDELVWEP